MFCRNKNISIFAQEVLKKQQQNKNNKCLDTHELNNSHCIKEKISTESCRLNSNELNLENHKELYEKLKEKLTSEQIDFFRKRGIILLSIKVVVNYVLVYKQL